MDVASSEADLVRRIAAGAASHARDPEAEAEFCRRMLPRVRLYGMRHLRDAASADDLAQQVLLTVLEALRAGRLREHDKLAPFVLGTARMTVLDLRRGTRRRSELLEQFAGDLVPVLAAGALSGPAPDAPPDAAAPERAQLTRCLQSLKERERSVIVMSYYDERVSGDVARTLGLSEANVRVIRHRALHQLRACLGVAA